MIYYLFFILAALGIGSIGLFVKLSGGMVNPFVLGFYRLAFGFALLAIVSPLIDKTTFKIKHRNLKQDALIGLLFAINLSATNFAFLYAPMQNVSLILSLTPVFVLIFAYFMLKEKITKSKIITLIIALVGLAILNPLQAKGLIGDLIALGIVITGGFMFVILRQVNQHESIGNVMWFFLFATLFTLPFPLIFGFGTITLSIISLGVISTGTAYLFYNLGYQKVEAEIGSLISNIISPIAAVIFGIFIIGETVQLRVIIGGIMLILAGIYLKTHLHTSKTVRNT